MKYTSKVEDAGSSVGQSVIDALADTMAKLAYLTFDEFDLSPTITPVLDLNAFRRNASTLQDMLSSDNTYTLGFDAHGKRHKIRKYITQPTYTTPLN